MSDSKVIKDILKEISRFVVGKAEIVKLMMVAMLSEGHILLEGPPGTGKTLLAKTFATSIGGSFKRVQMTPDLLPADIIGTTFYDMKKAEWRLKKGPIFTNVLLVDELNRASPKTQSALLEAMQERQVTLEGQTLTLPRPFLVLATQVPYGGEGTYPLTDVQMDRFAYRTLTNYPDPSEEKVIISKADFIDEFQVNQVTTPETVASLIEEVKKVHVSDRVKDYIINLVNKIRNMDEVYLGPSPRASIWLMKGGRALAYMDGRDYVIPDDIKALVPYVVTHRIKIKPEYVIEGIKPEELIERALKEVEVPKI